MVSQLDLSNNHLRGEDAEGEDAEGITAIADALRVHGGLTELSIYCKNVRDEGVDAICEALKSNKETNSTSGTILLVQSEQTLW